jgi:hypothetical protein
MSGKLIKIYVGAGLCSKLTWHTDNPQFIPALRLGFIKVNQPDLISEVGAIPLYPPRNL